MSPWSEKARWALDHHRVPYRYREYLSLFEEPVLRIRTRRLTGTVTVPVLFGSGPTINESWGIAREAERLGTGKSLFPSGRLEDIERWDARSEIALAASRVMEIPKLIEDAGARRESLPPFVPKLLRGAFDPVVVTVYRHIIRKYAIRKDTTHAARERLVAQLTALEQALAGGKRYILDEFSYADITMALTLQMVVPVGDRWKRLGSATRACMTEPELATRFAGLVAWRDALYDNHR